MILRKPYAFLIKYFKIINFLLAIFTLYIMYKSFNIVNFFNGYVANNYAGNYYAGFYTNYISLLLYFVIILSILGIIGISVLLINKKKPVKLYISSFIYYIIFLIFLIIIKNVMITLETEVIGSEASRIYRDLMLIMMIPQLSFMFSFILRGFGLSINKFNFETDLKELEILESDNEEVEITFKSDNVKLKRNFRRFFREFGYYVKENILMISIVGVILLGGLISLFFKLVPKTIDERYTQGEIFKISGLSYKLEDSIVTNLNQRGEKIDSYYVVVRLNIENSSDSDLKIDYNNFRLVIGNKYIYPSIDKGLEFIDYAQNITNDTIKANSKKIYSLVFRINEEDIKKTYKLKISNGILYTNGKQKGKFSFINISPIVISSVITENVTEIGKVISLQNSNLKNSNIKFSNAIIGKKYIYDYEACVSDKCNTYKNVINIDYSKKNKTLIVLSYEYTLDENSPFYGSSTTIKGFVDNFVKVKYTIDEKEKYANIINVTPNSLKNRVALETTSEVEDATSLYIVIVIRNKEYLIKIK